MTILYENLDRHFTAPKQIGFNHKKVPRKFKKKWAHILQNYTYMTLNEKRNDTNNS